MNLSENHPSPSSPADDDEEDDSCLLFSCQCESARSVSTLLSSLKHVTTGNNDSTAKNTPVTVFCSPTSLTFHVYGKARQSQASVDMQAGLFSEYYVRPRKDEEPPAQNNDNEEEDDWQAGGEFCVNLHTVLECLHVCSGWTITDTSTRLCLSYDLTSEIFRMELLDERGILSTAAIPGMVPPLSKMSLALAFRSSAICARMICNSHVLKEAMQELELVGGATSCTVALTEQEGLELAAVGDAGECLISLPAAGTLSLESQTAKARNYPLHSLRSGMRALDIAQETCVSINLEGMMAIQHQVLDTVGSGSPNFVDFIMGCLQDEEDENEAEEEPQSMTAASADEPTDALQSQRSERSRMTWNDNNDNVPLGSASGDEHDDNDSDDEDLLPPVSSIVQPLFGTVVVGRGGTQQQRRKRPARPRPSASMDGDHSSDDDGSRNLLEEPSQDESQPLDVTAPVRPKRRDREYDGSSSPEVVYGSQDADF